MKKKSDDLFQLIKSLTRNEKRHFRLGKRQEGDAIYMRLFDVIDDMDGDGYDEEIIYEKFAGAQFLNQLHSTKNHLYHLILKNLRNFHEDKFVESQLFNLLSEAAILQERGLYKLSEKQLRRALKIAIEYDKQLVILEVLRRQLSNLIETGVKDVDSKFKIHFKLIDKTLDNIRLEYIYTKFHYSLHIPLRHGMRRNPELDQKIAWITKHELFNSSEQNQATFEARYYFLNTHVAHHYLRHKMKKAAGILKQMIEHWKAHPQMIKIKPRLYLIQLSNYLDCQISSGVYDDVEEVLEEITSFKLNSFNDQAERFQNEKNHRLRYYINTRQYGKAEVLLPEIKKGLETYGTKINEARLVTIYYNVLVLNFVLEKHGECIEWINLILNNDRTSPKKIVKQAARIVELAVHYEMDNKRVLTNLFESTYKKLQRSGTLMEFEKKVLKQFKKLVKATEKKEENKLLSEFINELEPIYNNRPLPAGCAEIYLWAKSKLDAKPLRDLI